MAGPSGNTGPAIVVALVVALVIVVAAHLRRGSGPAASFCVADPPSARENFSPDDPGACARAQKHSRAARAEAEALMVAMGVV